MKPKSSVVTTTATTTGCNQQQSKSPFTYGNNDGNTMPFISNSDTDGHNKLITSSNKLEPLASSATTCGRGGISMAMKSLIVVALVAAVATGGMATTKDGRMATKDVFTNSFLVRLHRSVQDPAQLARKHGFHYMGKVVGEEGGHHFQHRGLPNARTRRSIPHTRKLKADPMIVSAVQLVGFKRVKRGYLPLRVENLVPAASLLNPNHPTDPDFKHQWYLRNTGQNGGKPRLDLNVEAAWALGYTGKNVTTAIMDDGVDYMHKDLKRNYNPRASWDFSSNDPFPYPRYTDDWFNSHGTRCAGEISAARDNGICGVGVAYDSLVAGIRMLDQPYMTDLIEANSMGHEPHLIDIYSASWGPTDDGKTVDGPRNATMKAIVRGVNEGRNGLGNIYVWASGDGGADDDCNCDGYAASMWTISINSAINDGSNAHYDESCSSTLASTFSNGAKDPSTGVATTDLYNQCTLTHSGTSAAAPEAAGVFALAMEANTRLTWRDIQHLTVLTSKRNSLFDAKLRFSWRMNGVGLEYNHLFGFGVLDAGAMVALAQDWETVPPRYHCQGGVVTEQKYLSSNQSAVLTLTTDACSGNDTQVNYLEHVQAVVTLNSTRRGDIELFLTSPMGTRSMILSRRPNDDDSSDGFTKWPFMTTHTWAENPRGTWMLEGRLNTGGRLEEGHIKEWTLMLHGTREAPYKHLQAHDPLSKLAIVKKAHENKKRM
uniref:Neuroendocrine convertase 2 n=1 Tax=Hirondellea gigas TaxID=1518452 RepID=A0A6A7G3X6_9CRUS